MATRPEMEYDRIGRGYVAGRRTDPTIARIIDRALGDAVTVVNVGAGTGSYEPQSRVVTAVEPSRTMRAQRSRLTAPAVVASAESLPFDDDAFDAAMAVLTVHHWADPAAGLAELCRVARDRVVLLTLDPSTFGTGWLVEEYVPEVGRIETDAFPSIEQTAAWLAGDVTTEVVEIPRECQDGFFEAFWARPEAYLADDARQCQSAWHRVGPEVEQRAVMSLRADLESGAWDERHGHLRTRESLDCGYRLMVAEL